MRLAYYAGASTAAAAACLLKAFHERPNFYSATVYLSQSNACLLILTNLLLLYACATIYTLQRLFYGPLRPIEIEQLSEKAWYAVLDTLLAMPSFREDVGGWLLTMFVLLLAGKVWGWIGEGRVDILEQQPPANPRLFHARLASSLMLSVVFDVYMTRYCLETVAADPRPGMMVIFTFEFAILTVFSTFTLCRYLLSLVSTLVTKQQMVKAIEERKTEIRAERAAAIRDQPEGESLPQPEEPIEVDENEVDVPGWEEKRRWLFALEMTADFLKLLLYIVFFTVSITFSGLPMHIMRDVYMTFASFTKRLGDYVNYKKATSDMNARYPDATTAEIRDDACIVCREDMIAWEDPAAAELDPAGARPRRDEGLRAKKLPCGHILHLRCLKAWLERQQVCPTCRRPVIAAIPPLATNAAPVNPAAGAPGVPPAPVANNAAQPRQANPNRARFFNLGPLRVGFLNAPAGQMDNIVNQLRGVQPPAQQAAHVPAVPAATAPGQPTGSDVQRGNEARLSQTELARLSQRLAHEANMLNVEQSQLSTIRAMAHEFGRLSSLHEHNTALGRTFQPSMPNLDASPQMLTGHPSQSVPAGNEALPQGMTLPEGWTLMPLHRQNQSLGNMPITRTVHHTVSPFGELAQPTPATGAPSANVAPPMLAELSSSLLSPPTGTDSSSQIPTPPSSTPVQTSRAPQATSTEVSSVGAAESEAARTTPWTSQNWDFNSSPERSEPEHNEKSSPENPHDKGKGRAVEVEDVPDTEE